MILVAGHVAKDMVRVDGQELQMVLTANEALGNCPKVRRFMYEMLITVYHCSRYPVR